MTEKPIYGYQVQTVKNVGMGWRTKYAIFASPQGAIAHADALANLIPDTYDVEVCHLEWIETHGYEHWYEGGGPEVPIFVVVGKRTDYTPHTRRKQTSE